MKKFLDVQPESLLAQLEDDSPCPAWEESPTLTLQPLSWILYTLYRQYFGHYTVIIVAITSPSRFYRCASNGAGCGRTPTTPNPCSRAQRPPRHGSSAPAAPARSVRARFPHGNVTPPWMRPAGSRRSPQPAGNGSGRWEGRRESRERTGKRRKKERRERKEGREGAGTAPRGWAPPVRALAALFWLSGRAVALPGESGIVRPPARSAQAPSRIPRLADPEPPPLPRPPLPSRGRAPPSPAEEAAAAPLSPSPSPGKSPRGRAREARRRLLLSRPLLSSRTARGSLPHRRCPRAAPPPPPLRQRARSRSPPRSPSLPFSLPRPRPLRAPPAPSPPIPQPRGDPSLHPLPKSGVSSGRSPQPPPHS